MQLIKIKDNLFFQIIICIILGILLFWSYDFKIQNKEEIENFQFIDSRGNQTAEPPPAAATAAAPTSAPDTNEIPF